MNKKRFGSLSVRHWAMIFALAVLTAAYVTRSDGPGLMAATTTMQASYRGKKALVIVS